MLLQAVLACVWQPRCSQAAFYPAMLNHQCRDDAVCGHSCNATVSIYHHYRWQYM